ncbi:MAG TPA: carboxynorspermidine decarboxylase [Lentisphaeria bacterium]|nr:MAG: carboxynorspermidine decarboxylase [Lentisphaerae bacterium GWF2_50_93]HCE45791.1 carboxynorspermidine decarboxylase [Lentisphaeria bacterium]
MTHLKTPYYLIDERKLKKNLEVIAKIREDSGAKSVLALKCFSTWCVFPLMRKYMDGTTSSSLFEARLGHEKFGKETHAFSVGYSREDIMEMRKFADKIIFNSTSQLEMFRDDVKGLKLGLRVNPGISYSHFDLADPARKYSRLGVLDKKKVMEMAPLISGVMFHFNCENDDFANLAKSMDYIGEKYGSLLKKMQWMSLGGGLFFTKKGYPVKEFCLKMKEFSGKYGVQIYLEPGEAAITQTTELVTTVLDVVHNKIDIAIIDASLEAHTLDHLIYRTTPRLSSPVPGPHKFMVAGRSCLAGDVFGTHKLKRPLKVGDEVRIADAAGYTMVKKNWFNGVMMPSIAVRRLSGKIEVVRKFGYEDFRDNLS